MNFFYFFILIITIACVNSNDNKLSYDLSTIESELSGKKLNDTLLMKERTLKETAWKTKIMYRSHDKLINEIDICINSEQNSTFLELMNYYNNTFQTNKNDSTFNTWHTDSSEFILYKNSDSSILVNIFKRTYL